MKRKHRRALRKHLLKADKPIVTVQAYRLYISI
jgi:hypothetical protein